MSAPHIVGEQGPDLSFIPEHRLRGPEREQKTQPSGVPTILGIAACILGPILARRMWQAAPLGDMLRQRGGQRQKVTRHDR